MHTSRWLFTLGWILIALGGALASWIQTAGGRVEVRDVRFVGASGTPMSALLYVPPGVSAKRPAPGILAIHGYINSRETQSGFAIEFARRGYVVLALDQTGHGYSAAPAFANGFGGPDGLRYLRSLDIVDKNNVGLEGHSMGGWASLAAAAALPDDYKAMVLEGSSTGSGFAPEGSPAYPRNLGLVYSQYDEFSVLMWGVAKAATVTSSPKLEKVFGVRGPIDPEQVYGSISDGTARRLYAPAVTHPGDHISRVAIGDAIDWFQRTLRGGNGLLPGNQIWPWKEFGTLVAFVGFVLLLLGTGGLLLRTSAFASLRAPPAEPRGVTGGGWWLSALIFLALPILTYFPFFRLGARLVPSALWPQSITNQIMVWALLNGLIGLALFLVWRFTAGARQGGGAPAYGLAQANGRGSVWGAVWKSALFAVTVVAVGYLSLLLSDYFFKTDYRFWVLGLKLMNPPQLRMFLSYLLPFTLYFLAAALVLHGQLRRGRSTSMWLNVALMAGGFLVFLAVQYGSLFARDQLFTPGEPLNVIVAIQFLPLLAIVGVIFSYFFRRTGLIYAGAFISALFVTWFIVAGQATQFPL